MARENGRISYQDAKPAAIVFSPDEIPELLRAHGEHFSNALAAEIMKESLAALSRRANRYIE